MQAPPPHCASWLAGPRSEAYAAPAHAPDRFLRLPPVSSVCSVLTSQDRKSTGSLCWSIVKRLPLADITACGGRGTEARRGVWRGWAAVHAGWAGGRQGRVRRGWAAVQAGWAGGRLCGPVQQGEVVEEHSWQAMGK